MSGKQRLGWFAFGFVAGVALAIGAFAALAHLVAAGLP